MNLSKELLGKLGAASLAKGISSLAADLSEAQRLAIADCENSEKAITLLKQYVGNEKVEQALAKAAVEVADTFSEHLGHGTTP